MSDGIPEGYIIKNGKLIREHYQTHFEGEHLTIPNGLHTLDSHCFSGCRNLREVVLPPSVRDISAYAFSNCEKLEVVTFSPHLRSIGQHAFSGCVTLKMVDLPEGLVEIGERAFADCVDLQVFCIPESVQKLGKAVLDGVPAVDTLSVPEKLLGDMCMRSRLGMPNTEGLFIKGDTLTDVASRINTIAVPEGVRVIGADALSRPHGRQQIVVTSLPSTLEVIRRNDVEDKAALAAQLPAGYFLGRKPLPPDPNLDLFKALKKQKKVTIDQAASVFLIQPDSYSEAALGVLLGREATWEEAFAAMLKVLEDPQVCRAGQALQKAALFWYTGDTERLAGFTNDLRACFARAGIQPASGESWDELIQNMILAAAKISPRQEAFEDVLLADGGGAAPPHLVKAALVPYVASRMLAVGPVTVPACIPAADRAAEKLRLRTLQRILPEVLMPKGNLLEWGQYAYARFASEDQMCALIDQLEGVCRGAPFYCHCQNECSELRRVISLSPTAAAIKYAAEKWFDCMPGDRYKIGTNMLSWMVHRLDDSLISVKNPSGLKLNPDGTKTYVDHLGRPLVQLHPREGAVEYENCRTHRRTKNVPKDAQPYQQAIRADAALVQQYFTATRRWISNEIVSAWKTGDPYSPRVWQGVYEDAELASRAGETIWKQGNAVFRLHSMACLDADGRPYTPNDREPIHLVHPVDLTVQELGIWRGILAEAPNPALPQQLAGPVYTETYLLQNPYKTLQLGEKAFLELGGEYEHGYYGEQFVPLGENYRITFPSRFYDDEEFPVEISGFGELERDAQVILFELDKLTFSGRLKNDDPTLETFLRGVDDTVFHSFLPGILESKASFLKAVALEEAHCRELGSLRSDLTL